jgi:hypothetical protein
MLVALLVGLSWCLVACAPPPPADDETEVDTETLTEEVSGPERTFDEWARGVTDLEQVSARWVFIQIINREWHGANAVGVCRAAKAGCSNIVTWRWLAPEIKGATLRIEPKNPGENCFPPSPAELLPPNPTDVSRAVKADCPVDSWFYTITCEGSEECPAEPLDPIIEIEN